MGSHRGGVCWEEELHCAIIMVGKHFANHALSSKGWPAAATHPGQVSPAPQASRLAGRPAGKTNVPQCFAAPPVFCANTACAALNSMSAMPFL